MAQNPSPSRALCWWLVACAAMVCIMVLLGGATRLTHSGLSMVEWQPLNPLPPLTADQWQAAFAHYQQSPEFLKANSWMSVDDFKGIYWLEYIHRLWGRVIAVVFLVPAVWFWGKGQVDRRLAWKLVGLFGLLGFQGALGWFMVASGLEDRPSVSQYRLAAHLITAFVFYGCVLWVALGCFRASGLARAIAPDAKASRRALIAASAILVVVTWGALTAGLHAGLIYNTFPLMDGKLIPDGLGDVSPWWLNPFENVITVQFAHRVLAILLVIKIAGLWLRSRNVPLAPTARLLTNGLLAMVFVQAGLGISTLLLVVPLPLALAHQTGALILFTLAICLAHELSPVAATAPRAEPVELQLRAAE